MIPYNVVYNHKQHVECSIKQDLKSIFTSISVWFIITNMPFLLLLQILDLSYYLPFNVAFGYTLYN